MPDSRAGAPRHRRPQLDARLTVGRRMRLALIALVVVGCGSDAATVATSVPGCTDGTPTGAQVTNRPGQTRFWVEDSDLVVKESDVVLVGTVISAKNPYGDATCPNGTVPSQDLIVRVDEVLYGEPISGEIHVITWDTAMLAEPADAGPDAWSEVIVAITRLNADTWEARGPGHITTTGSRSSWDRIIAAAEGEDQ